MWTTQPVNGTTSKWNEEDKQPSWG